jgi:FAD synthetase
MSQPSEDPAERARRYIATMEKALQQNNPLKEGMMVEVANIAKVSDAIHRYLQDARFYLTSGKPTTALASIAYAEGLLDALKFLNLTRNVETETQ